MLLGLTIRDVVLIDRLSLAFRPGLCVLTGETGAGKSILLDALGLALGRRADSSLVRPGANEASVAAEFAVEPDHPAAAILRVAGMSTDLAGTIVLRRLVGADGKSRAFVNDEAASVGLMRELGDSLVEIQGQGEQRGLLDPATHRTLLDDAAEHEVALAALAISWREWRAAREQADDAARRLADSRAEEDLLRHHKAELDALTPEEDEEERLGTRRLLMQNAERLGEAVAGAIAEIDGEAGAQGALARALRRLDRARDRAQGLLDGAGAAAERAATETMEALAALGRRGGGAGTRSARARRGRGAALRAARWRGSTASRSPICRGCARSSGPGSRASRPTPKRLRRLKQEWPRRVPGTLPLPTPSPLNASAPRAGSMQGLRRN